MCIRDRYAILGRKGFFPIEDAIAYLRKSSSPFEGHIERTIPGVEWSTGNLGQGLSVGCGFALASKIKNIPYNVFVVMGDGEQQKGQISEARRVAKKYFLNNLIGIVDLNGLQICGKIDSVMPSNIKDEYLSDGWEVIEIDGHDFVQIYKALKKAVFNLSSPTLILAHTIMGKGVSFMENNVEYHGRALNLEEYKKAMAELNLEDDLSLFKRKREELSSFSYRRKPKNCIISIDIGKPRTYRNEKIDSRTAWGKALEDIAKINKSNPKFVPIAVIDCDLSPSVRTVNFSKILPSNFIQCGIQEHCAATIAGALSIEGILTFFADFGVC